MARSVMSWQTHAEDTGEKRLELEKAGRSEERWKRQVV